MRLPRPISLVLAVAALAACSKPPPERFLDRRTAAVAVTPSLEAFARQSAEVLALAGSFPGGQALEELRAVTVARLGVDLLDPDALVEAGLDPRRGAAVGLDLPNVLLVVPVADQERLAALADRFAGETLGLQRRSVGTPSFMGQKPMDDSIDEDLVHWQSSEGEPSVVSYGFARKTAVIGFGPDAEKQVKAAMRLEKEDAIEARDDYRHTVAALGPGQVIVFYVAPRLQPTGPLPPGPAIAFGLAGGSERLALTVSEAPAEGSPPLAPPKADAGPLVARLHPGAALVGRSDADIAALITKEKVEALFDEHEPRAEARQAILDAVDSLGGAAAFGVGIAPPSGEGSSFEDAPFAFLRFEAVLGLRDAAKMRQVARWFAAQAEGEVRGGEEGPWVASLGGGELGVAVEEKQVVFAVGPAGALAALSGRSGTVFRPPTATAVAAFASPLGGMFLDGARLAGDVRAIPAAASDEVLPRLLGVLSRIRAVSASSELRDGAQRSEVVVELAPVEVQ